MRRKVIDKVRYFPPYGGPSTWREETDFQLCAVENGFKLVFCPHTVSFHHARSSVSFGANRFKGDLDYLGRIFQNNRLLLERHKKFLEETYPSALMFRSPWLTSVFYLIRNIIWLIRVEGYRWYQSRRYLIFKWR
jgi:GT2 family glycosyltransferase